MSRKHDTKTAAKRAQRAVLLRLYGPWCWICREKGVRGGLARIDTTLTWPHPMAFTRDHVIPRSEGGANAVSNLRPAHSCCNAARGGHDVDTPWRTRKQN